MHAVLENVARRITSELEWLDSDASQAQPLGSSHNWNIQQVVEHLALTSRFTAKRLEIRLDKGRISRDQSRSWLQWTLQLMVLSFGHFPSGAPPLEGTEPAPGEFPAMNGRDLARLLREEFEAMDTALDRCRRKFGMERVAVHPIFGPLRVDQWRRFNALHAIHHLKQIRRVRQQVAPHAVPEVARNISLAKELQIPAQRSLT